jgi:hypothetical protein
VLGSQTSVLVKKQINAGIFMHHLMSNTYQFLCQPEPADPSLAGGPIAVGII